MYKNFEKLLVKNNTTAYQVARATGISTVTFTHWKQGKYIPKVDKLIRIANYFNVSVEYLLKESE